MPSKDPEIKKRARKAWESRNPEKRKECRDRIITRNRNYIKNILTKACCIDCRNSDIRVLEFDHVRGLKIANVSNMMYAGCPLSKIQEEIDKCEIRCANCHRLKTLERKQFFKIEDNDT